MAMTLDGSNGVTFNDSSLQGAAASPFGLKNRIINGDMRIDQRNAGASGTAIAFTIDRWGYGATQASKGTWQQNAGSVTPPAGFQNYWGFTSSSAYSVTASDQFYLYQGIEGYNVADLGLGASGASTFTISFWVRSSLTGTFGASVQNASQNRSYPFSYTISSANTWEQKTVTIVGDTSGTWLKTNGCGMYLLFSLGMGSTFSGTAGTWAASNFISATGATSVVGTNGATWYITGVQLERNTTATPFEWLPYGTEKTLCQRYFELMYVLCSAYGNGSNGIYWPIPVKVSKRATPTTTIVSTDNAVNVVGSVTTEVGGTANAATESIQLTYTGAPATGLTRVGANITISAEL